MNNVIYTTIRNKRNAPIGIIMAGPDKDGVIQLSFSKLKKGDKFNRQLGVEIAKNRIEKGRPLKPIPQSFKVFTLEMAKRAARYFKDKKLSAKIEEMTKPVAPTPVPEKKEEIPAVTSYYAGFGG